MWVNKLFLTCVFVLVTSENRFEKDNNGPKKARLFTFNTNDDDAVTVDLEFSIPFLTIPAKNAVSYFNGFWPSVPSININLATLALGGAIIFGSTVLLPLLSKNLAAQYPHDRYSRLLDSAQFSTDALLDIASQLLADGQSVRGCALRISCWTAQRSDAETIRTWHQIMSNNLLSPVINSTAVADAMMSGKHGRDCETYSPCPLKEQHVPMLLNNLALFNSIR
ncbi:uncharacterized protein LOC126375324 [Pectinophora gossypiella]|uniref:uncharacterized protein LOC126375324 n=1 Tax=Pectinophora gossypiella TaxID=13191 RepID=UPI00214E9084|nr:uncharacterized protein LOC126375324 [Pectinophora gossypiella]